MTILNINKKLKLFKCLNYTLFIIVLSAINIHQLFAQELIWHKMFDSGGKDNAKAVATDSEGNIVVTGCTHHGNIEGSLIVKYNTAGDTIWSKKLLDDNFSDAVAVHIDDSDNIYVIGEFSVLNDGNYFRVIKYTPTGTVKEIVSISDTFNVGRISAAIDSKKNIIIASTTFNYWGEYITIKYDSSGNLIWQKQYDGGWEDRLKDVTVDDSDNIIVTGFSDSDINWDWCTIKYSPEGETLWVRRHDVAITDWAYGVTTDREGNVIVVGDAHIQYPGTGGSTAMVIKYSAEGDTLWSKIFRDTLQYEELGQFNDVITDSACNIYLVGDYFNWDTSSSGGYYYYIHKCTESGDSVWSFKYKVIERSDGTSGITLDKWGNVIVTGTKRPSSVCPLSEYDFLTLKLSNNTTNIWKNGNISIYPKIFTLEQNYPNPFNSKTIIKYQLKEYSHINLTIYNMLGQKVITLKNEKEKAGIYSVSLDGSYLAGGLYFYRLTVGNKSLTKKLLLIR